SAARGPFGLCTTSAVSRAVSPTVITTNSNRVHTVERTDRILVHSARSRPANLSPAPLVWAADNTLTSAPGCAVAGSAVTGLSLSARGAGRSRAHRTQDCPTSVP